jgi:hypothetical protein
MIAVTIPFVCPSVIKYLFLRRHKAPDISLRFSVLVLWIYPNIQYLQLASYVLAYS